MVRVIRFYQSSIGKKAVMAITGVILFLFVIVHMLGNLQVYLGPAALNSYAAFLHKNPGLVWFTRIVLLLCVLVHIWAALEITVWRLRARPTQYRTKKSIRSTYASRTMIWSGPILAAFIVYHLLHFTVGSAHPAFSKTDVFANVVTGFQVAPVAIFYIVAMLCLGFHLWHGVGSFFQSLGIGATTKKWVARFSQISTAIIVLGNISIPVTVMAGVIKL